jgi:3-deoxy-D-manno-octulosonic acid kinase
MLAKTIYMGMPESNAIAGAQVSTLALNLEVLPDGLALVHRACVSETQITLFDPAQYQDVKTLRDGRGQAFQVRGSFGVGALRHFRRGGMTGALWQDRYLFTGAERTRCFRELRLLAWLYAQGLPVPMPLACRFLRNGMIYRADILSAWLPGANPLSAHVQSASIGDFSAVGAMLGSFHVVGLWHADLNAHNILLTDNGPALIDFDRCKRRSQQKDWQEANLARLLRSLTKLGFAARADFQTALWPALRTAYDLRLANHSATP